MWDLVWEDGRRNQFVLFNYLLTRINQNPMRLTLIPFESTPSRDPRTLLSVGLTPYRSITSHTPMVWTFVGDNYPLPEAGTKDVCHCTWVETGLWKSSFPLEMLHSCASLRKNTYLLVWFWFCPTGADTAQMGKGGIHLRLCPLCGSDNISSRKPL